MLRADLANGYDTGYRMSVLNLKSERARVPARAYPGNSENRVALHRAGNRETDPIRSDSMRSDLRLGKCTLRVISHDFC